MDRLTTLMKRFQLSVRPAPEAAATLLVTACGNGDPAQVIFGSGAQAQATGPILISARVDWGGTANPLMAALPGHVTLDLCDDPEAASLVGLMLAELRAQRCGVDSVIDRLGEVLIVRMLRARIEAGSAQPGVLAGLADPRLSRAIVAIHDAPGRDWRNEDLAQEAGLSLSRFAETFLATVGETPASYLRRWRLTLARQDLERGDRVEQVARRYGYRSPDGFARAFRKRFGVKPLALRAG
ncbi:AraC family transcriptional regulator [Seohaeicola saemankumensis]|nr:AraC family transcriptional regulator [Seohaeicola saemankumensis]